MDLRWYYVILRNLYSDIGSWYLLKIIYLNIILPYCQMEGIEALDLRVVAQKLIQSYFLEFLTIDPVQEVFSKEEVASYLAQLRNLQIIDCVIDLFSSINEN